MTPEEKQEIVQAVIAALKTNGRTIMQLTEVTQLTDNDYFEIHGGRRIAYSYLYSNVMSETENIIENFETDVNTALAGKLNGYNASWIWSSSQRTEERFNEFVAAAQAHKVIYDGFSGLIMNATYNPLASSIFIWYYNYDSSQVECTLTLSNGSVTLSPNTVKSFATTTSVTAVANRVTTLERSVSDLSGLSADVTNLDTRLTTAEGSITSITGETGALNVGYHNINDPAFASAYTVSAALDLIIDNMKEVYCTMEQYQAWVDAGTIDENTKYYIYEE